MPSTRLNYGTHPDTKGPLFRCRCSGDELAEYIEQGHSEELRPEKRVREDEVHPTVEDAEQQENVLANSPNSDRKKLQRGGQAEAAAPIGGGAGSSASPQHCQQEHHPRERES